MVIHTCMPAHRQQCASPIADALGATVKIKLRPTQITIPVKSRDQLE